MANTNATQFLNVDLELVATVDLDPLLARLASGTITLRDSVEHGRRTVWLELAEQQQDVEQALLGFARMIESLPDDLRRIWMACDDRCLNIGIQAAHEPHAAAFHIPAPALTRIAGLSARVEITIYAAQASTSGPGGSDSH
jgi:hypothetical protein